MTAIKANLSIERVVAILTPIFGAASAWLTGLIATDFPGLPTIPAGDVTALEIAGFTGAVAAALKWLHGRQKYVTLTDDAKKTILDLETHMHAYLATNPAAAAAVSDIEDRLKAHESSIVAAFDQHMPEAVRQALAALFDQAKTSASGQGINFTCSTVPLGTPAAAEPAAAPPEPPVDPEPPAAA